MTTQVGEMLEATEGVTTLGRALRTELGLLAELKAQLVEQRAACAADDTLALEAVVQQISRTLFTLREARKQRGLLLEMVTGEPGVALADAGELLPALDRTGFRALCGELHAGAVAANRELLINQAAIRRAIESGEQFLHHLLTAPGPTSDAEPAQCGVLFNQRA